MEDVYSPLIQLRRDDDLSSEIEDVLLKLDAFFPPLRVLAEHSSQIAMALSSSATEKNFQTGEDMFTNDDIMRITAI